MKKYKHTGKALFFSVFSMFMSMTLLIGSTYAWFTDSASTGVNKIQSGNLDVVLEVPTKWDLAGNITEWGSAEGSVLDFIDPKGKNNTILWEPGAVYQLPELRITNKGNVDIKYQVFINGVYGDMELAEVLEVQCKKESEQVQTEEVVTEQVETEQAATEVMPTLKEVMTLAADADGIIHGDLKAGESTESYTISVKMKDNVPNEYQNLTLKGLSITVFATQATSENDSFGNTYDEGAEFGRKYVGTQRELTNALQTMEDGGSLILTENITIDSLTADKNATIFLNGKTLTVSNVILSAGKTIAFKGGMLSPTTLSGNGNVIVSGVTVDASMKEISTVAEGDTEENATEMSANKDQTKLSAVTIAEKNITMTLEADNSFIGAEGGNGIHILAGANLTLNGRGTIKAVGNAGIDHRDADGNVLVGDSAFTGGSGIRVDGTLLIDAVQGVTALGYGTEGYGIGGDASKIEIINSEIIEALGGNAQATAFTDSSIQASAVGKPAIGTEHEGGEIILTNTIVNKATGGINAQAIGSIYSLVGKVTLTISDDFKWSGVVNGASQSNEN